MINVILLSILIVYFVYPYYWTDDIVETFEGKEYVYYEIYDNGECLTLRKKLDEATREQYKVILNKFSRVYVLRFSEPQIGNDIIYFSSRPQAPYFCQNYYRNSGYYCICRDYSALYAELLTLTQQYIKEDAEFYSYWNEV